MIFRVFFLLWFAVHLGACPVEGSAIGEEGVPCKANGECGGDLNCVGDVCTDAGNLDGSAEGTSEGNSLMDAGSPDGDGEGATEGSSLVDAGAATGSVDGTEVIDSGSSDGSTVGTEIIDSGSSDCSLAAYCGDGVQDSNEECDLGQANNTGAAGGCRSDCLLSEKTYYVAPVSQGDANGTNVPDAVYYKSGSFWSVVQSELSIRPVIVVFLIGDYLEGFTLSEIGHPQNHLTLQGETDTGMQFNPPASAPVATMMYVKGCQNMTIKDFNFRGNITGYGLTLRKNGDVKSHDITIDSCTWIDLPTIYYGGMGAHYESYNITIQNNRFKRLGEDSHAHMIYNAYSPQHISILNNHFEDCSGSHVRCRDNADYCTISGNTFIQTGTYQNQHSSSTTFIQVPLFNDVDPGDEVFATHYDFSENVFNFYSGVPGTTTAISFYHKGFSPPGTNYLLTSAQGDVLESGSPASVKDLLWRNFGIDTDEVLIYENQYINTDIRVDFASRVGYGSQDLGWDDNAEIYRAMALRDVFEANFESDTVGQTPSSFYVMEYSGNTSVRVRSDKSVSGSQSIRLYDNSSDHNAYIRYTLPNMKAGYFAAWVYLNSGTSNKYIFYAIENGTPTSYLLTAKSNGEWGNGNGDFSWLFNPNFSLGEWVLVEIVFDVREGKYSVWLDEEQVADEIAIPNNPSDVWDYLYMNPAPIDSWGSMYVDDLQIKDLTEEVD